jgi:hypothetical protein
MPSPNRWLVSSAPRKQATISSSLLTPSTRMTVNIRRARGDAITTSPCPFRGRFLDIGQLGQQVWETVPQW